MDLGSFREDVTRELQAMGAKMTFLNEQGVATRKQLDEAQSRVVAFGIELRQGLPQLVAQVQASAQELAGMQETSRIFMRDGQALQADLRRLRAELTTLHAQAHFDVAAAAPLPAQPQQQQQPRFASGSGPLGGAGAAAAAAPLSEPQAQAQ